MDKLELQFGGYTTAGKRAENQDAFAALQPESDLLDTKGAVAVVADGASTCRQAQLASVTCVTNFVDDYLATPESWSVKRAALRVLRGLNLWCLGHRSTQFDQQSDMVTTFSGAVFKSASAHLFHVGDSRIYRFQDGIIEQLTRDHKGYQGEISYLTRAVGIDPHLDVDYRLVDLQPEDLFIFSSDGVHDVLSDRQIASLIADGTDDLELLAKTVVDQAIEAGSPDNITCLIVRVKQLPSYGINENYLQIQRLAVPPALEIGMKLEGYRILQTVFQGQRSCLYKAVNEQDGKIYGLKAPTQEYANDKDYLRGFAHESWIGQRVNHPNVMRIHHRPEKTAFLYHVCEYIEGQTLRQWMVDNPKPSLDQVRVIIKQIVAALRALQRLDMVHRDLRPENIMISTQNQVKLIDFGSVYVAGLDEDQPQPNKFDGSNLSYVSPEYVLEQQSSHQSDIFSLAVICYEMLSGALPYPVISRQSSVPHSYTKWDYESLGKYRNELPPWVNLALKKALQPQPENRYQAFSEFETDLLKPNQSMIEAAQDAPLIERNPLLFWKLVSGVLLAANLLQFIV